MAMEVEALSYIVAMMMLVLCISFYDLLLLNRRKT
jgi:hypothetical protein